MSQTEKIKQETRKLLDQAYEKVPKPIKKFGRELTSDRRQKSFKERVERGKKLLSGTIASRTPKFGIGNKIGLKPRKEKGRKK